jgi:hypothetical protein
LETVSRRVRDDSAAHVSAAKAMVLADAARVGRLVSIPVALLRVLGDRLRPRAFRRERAAERRAEQQARS